MQNIQFCVIRAQNIWLRSFLRWPSISLSAKKEEKTTRSQMECQRNHKTIVVKISKPDFWFLHIFNDFVHSKSKQEQ